MLSGIRQQGVVGKDGKIEIHTSELAEGTLVEVIVLSEQSTSSSEDIALPGDMATQDTTAYLLSTESNRHHLMASIEQTKEKKHLISLTPEEWDEEYNVHP